jgi:hypothetical protein
VHLAAGDPGKIAVAYYRGVREPGQAKPVWYTHVLHSLNVRDASPEVVDQQVSDVPAYRWTASEMMGVCSDPADPTGGVQNGLVCSRSTDVWGITEDAQCRVGLVWPTMGPSTADADGGTNGLPNAQNGTWVTTQTGGPDLCSSPRSLPGGSFASPYAPAIDVPGSSGSTRAGTQCSDRLAPLSHFRGRVRAGRRGVSLHGVARDRGCGKRLRFVRVAIARRLAAPRCRFLRGDGTFGRRVNCHRTTYIAVRGTRTWSLRVRGKLPRGRYVAWSRGVDAAGNIERKNRGRNLIRFRVR